MKKILLGSILLLGILTQIEAENNQVFVKRSGVNKIVLFDEENPKTIFRTDKDYIKTLRVSPDGNSISIVEKTRIIVRNNELIALPKNRLTIITKDGEILKVLNEDVQKHVWSPDGNKIALITGEWREVGMGFKPDGAFIYNLETGERDIVLDVPYPVDLSWDNNSDNLYLKDFHRPDGKYIYNYKLSSKETKVTDYFDFFFSPSGDYYYKPKNPVRDIEKFQVFDAKMNQPILLTLPENIGFPIKWIFDHGNYLLFEKKDETFEYVKFPPSKPGAFQLKKIKSGTLHKVTYSIYDVKNNVVVKEEKTDMVSEWIGDRFSLPIQSKGKAPKKLTLE